MMNGYPADWAQLTPTQKREYRLSRFLNPTNVKFVSIVVLVTVCLLSWMQNRHGHIEVFQVFQVMDRIHIRIPDRLHLASKLLYVNLHGYP